MSTTTQGSPEAESRPTVGAIIVAAGRSSRMGQADKIFVPVLERPLIYYSLRALNDAPKVNVIVLVLSSHNIDDGRRLVDENGWHKVREICVGGERRQDSVRIGLDRLQDTDWTMVHDGARPCIDGDIVSRGLMEARHSGAAVAAVRVRDTIKTAGPDLTVTSTLSRDGLWAVQTPQVFSTDLLSRAHRQVSEEVTDDASMVELVGGSVRIFMGSYENIKVATPEDIPIAEAILKARVEKGPGRRQ